jgi:hypothetical protein
VPTAPSRRPAPAPAVAQLQRSLGNRSMRALLARDPKPAHPAKLDKRRGEFAQITDAYPSGGMDQKTWSDTVAAAKDALDAGKIDDAKALYTKLYLDLAATAGADKLRDVGANPKINFAQAKDKGYAPGLNLVLAAGASKDGTTAFIDKAGDFGDKLDTKDPMNPKLLLDPKDPPHIAIRLYSSSFVADKALSLGTLRHEMLHARHHELVLDALDKRKSPKGAIDKLLVTDIGKGKREDTELLAYVEGFMTAFHLINPAPPTNHPVFIELRGVLYTGTVYPWSNADASVRDEALGRLREYYCHTLDAKHQAALDAWVKELDAQVTKDKAALKSGSDAGATQTAKADAFQWLEHFVQGMKEVATGSCAAPAPKKTRAKQATAQSR